MSIKLDLSSYDAIPKKVFVSWKTKDILENQSPVILNGIANLKKINPEYTIEISDDYDVERYLKSNLSKWEYFKIRNKKIVEKVDLWRLLKVYNEGGIYIDIDRYCNIPFREIILPNTKCILPTHADIDFSQDIMISCKNNPIFKKAIDLNLKSRFLLNPRGVFHLGPPLYMKAVTEVVFGKSNSRKPGQAIMNRYRDLLNASEYFQTFKEELPDKSLVYTYKESAFIKGNGKQKEDFYKSQEITPWNKGFDKNTLYALGIIFFLLLIFYLSTLL